MYKSHVVTGRIIEIQGDRVLTQQGDTLCTYHSRYYMMPPVDAELETESGLTVVPVISVPEAGVSRFRKSRSPARPWFSIQKKSANRI